MEVSDIWTDLNPQRAYIRRPKWTCFVVGGKRVCMLVTKSENIVYHIYAEDARHTHTTRPSRVGHTSTRTFAWRFCEIKLFWAWIWEWVDLQSRDIRSVSTYLCAPCLKW